jgi:hypothetical protein
MPSGPSSAVRASWESFVSEALVELLALLSSLKLTLSVRRGLLHSEPITLGMAAIKNLALSQGSQLYLSGVTCSPKLINRFLEFLNLLNQGSAEKFKGVQALFRVSLLAQELAHKL